MYEYCSSEESDTASLDHLSDGEDEIIEVRTKKVEPAPKKKASKMFDENIFSRIYNGLYKDDFTSEKDHVPK